MSYGTFDRDVIGGKTPLRVSPIKGITNATAILNKMPANIDLSKKTENDGLANFAHFAKQFTKNPTKQQLSKAASIFASSGGGV